MDKKIDNFINSRIDNGLYPGAQVFISRKGKTVYSRSFGSKLKGSDSASEKVNPDTLFNIESITKVMVTLPLVFKLVEEGKIILDDRVSDYIPEFGTSEEKKKVTVRDLLNFTGGVPLEDPAGCLEAAEKGELDKAWAVHYTQDSEYTPGTKVLYSDVSCRILGKILEKILGKTLSEAADEYIFSPLGMKHTMFNPPDRMQCAATGFSDTGRPLRGDICQDLEHYLGEVLGSDGLFSNAEDMNKFSLMLLNGGSYNGKKIFSEVSVSKMTEGITNFEIFEQARSGLHYIVSGPKTYFWEYAQSEFSFFGDLVSDRAIGKMGGAGTFLLIDPEYDLVIVYLTNYGQPENTLEGEASWKKYLSEINPMGLCNIVIAAL